MKFPSWLFPLFALTLISSHGSAVERLPVEDFARTPDAMRGRLSPDGKYFAFIRTQADKPLMLFMELATGKVASLELGEAALANGATKEVADYSWVGNRRVMITSAVWDLIYGVMAVDIDGENKVSISGAEDNQISLHDSKLYLREILYRSFDKDQTVLMLDRHEGGGGRTNRPDVMEVRSTVGMASTLVKNPGEVGRWGVDFKGVVRLGILTHGEQSGAIFRDSEAAPWRTILPLKQRTGGMRPLGFDAANNKVFVSGLTNEKRWTVFPLDPATGTLGEPLLTDPEYDILQDHFVPSLDGISLTTPVLSRKKETLVGVRYFTDAPRVRWFDRDFAAYQKAVDRALPNTINMLVNASEDERQMLWIGMSDQDPGAYYLADLDKHTFKRLVSRMSWIKPAQMAPMLAVKYKARDGLVIHGYLTTPVGHEPKGLPLVIMPHGGPWVRDVWGYDPLVQLIANRGYAVLQMNYRGSPGFGEELFTNAKRQIGGKIQDDIEDATRWAIAAGVADPQRIAIAGGSYGGYSTLFALGHNPELYRCGISIAGVTDWPAIYDDRRSDPDYKAANRYWREQIGDPDKDRERLREISPVSFADKITAPLLIIQGKDDRTVPQDQAKLMIAALDKAGRKPESLFLSEVGHNFGHEKKRIEIFKSVAAFLEKNLGPGVN